MLRPLSIYFCFLYNHATRADRLIRDAHWELNPDRMNKWTPNTYTLDSGVKVVDYYKLDQKTIHNFDKIVKETNKVWPSAFGQVRDVEIAVVPFLDALQTHDIV